MATRKTEPQEIENDVEIVDAPAYDPWQDMRPIFVPKMSRTEQSTLEVGVNNRTFFVPKEQMVMLPYPLWSIVREMVDRRKAMEDEAKKSSGIRQV